VAVMGFNSDTCWRLDPDRNRVLLAGIGLLLNWAIFQRDLPLLQGTILVLACFSCF